MSYISPSSSFHFLKFKKILEDPGERGPLCSTHSCNMQHITNVQGIFTEQMDTSILIFGEGTKPPLPLKPSLHPQAAWGPAEWTVENAKDFSSSEAGRRKTAASPLCQVPELFALISVPCYLSSQDWGPFIIPSVIARSNLHCQRLKPVTSSNSIPCTGPKQKFVRWRCDLRLLPPWFLSFTRMAPLTERPGFQVRSGPR